jgi:hypothetical protein
MKKTMIALLLAGSLYAAEPVNGGRASKTGDESATTNKSNASFLPVATIRSSGGLILNGVPTPAGVNSVIVTRGDVVQTLNAAATATYRDGRVVNLAAGTQFSIPNNSRGGIVTIGQRGVNTTPMQLTGVSYRLP